MESPIPTEVLDDLCSRFIINVPKEERTDLIRICFQVELAHWFYLDFYSKNRQFKKRRTIGIKEFAALVFEHIPFLKPFALGIDRIIDDWKGYKYSVPTYGAILLNEDLTQVLLVQSYCSKSSWGFPKGKINKGEFPWQCAIREVFEETGFDSAEILDPSEFIEATVNEQVVRLYIIPGVSSSQHFEPKTRNEIKSINWFPLCDLPATKKEAASKIRAGVPHTYFMVSPFIRKLRHWIYENYLNPRPSKCAKRPRHKSCSDIEFFHFKDYHPSLKNMKLRTPKRNLDREWTSSEEETPQGNSSAAEWDETTPRISPISTKNSSVPENKKRHTNASRSLISSFASPRHESLRKYEKSVMVNCRSIECILMSSQSNSTANSRNHEKCERLPRPARYDSNQVECINEKENLRLCQTCSPKLKFNSEPLTEVIDPLSSLGNLISSPNRKKQIEVQTLEYRMKLLSVDESQCTRNFTSQRGSSNDKPALPTLINHDNKVSSFVEVIKQNGEARNGSSKSFAVVHFIEISLSDSFIQYGIKAWANFKFDKRAIVRCMNTINQQSK